MKRIGYLYFLHHLSVVAADDVTDETDRLSIFYPPSIRFIRYAAGYLLPEFCGILIVAFEVLAYSESNY
jgi:hypothetical protein